MAHIIIHVNVFLFNTHPQYAGKQTPTSVRSAIVQQLKLWSSLYKDQHKLLEAYNMLDKTGNTNIKVGL